MTLSIEGSLYEDIFGIPWLKKTVPIKQSFNLGTVAAGENIAIMNGEVTIGIAPTIDVAGDLEIDVKIAVLGFTVVNQTEVLAKAIASGPQKLKVGGGQLEFTGTYTITE